MPRPSDEFTAESVRGIRPRAAPSRERRESREISAVDGAADASTSTGERNWSHARSIAENGNGAERAAEADKLRLRMSCEAFGKRKDCTDMMERMMLSAISRFPEDPLEYMTTYLEREVETGVVVPGDEGKGWGEGLHGRDTDLHEKTTAFAGRLDFQTICYKLSAAMIEQKPEDPVAFALDFLRTLKEEGVFDSKPPASAVSS